MTHRLCRIVFFSLVPFGLAVQNQSQIKPLGINPNRQTSSPSSGPDLPNWQIVSVPGKGINFKLPADWRHDTFEPVIDEGTYTIQPSEWNTANKDLPNRDRIRILTTTYHNGFAWFGHPASRAEMLENKFERVTQLAQSRLKNMSVSEVKTVYLGEVEGVFRIERVNSQDKNKASRLANIWTGYRTYQGRPQETDIDISSTLRGEALLKTIFSTLEVAHDKDAPQK